MDDFLNELATYLDAQSSSFTFTADAGRNLFTNTQPDSPEDITAIFGLPGAPIRAHRSVPALHFPRFQVITRGTTYEEAATLHRAARAILHGLLNINLTNWRIIRCHAESEGGPIGTDKKGRSEFSCNYTAETHNITP